MKILINHFSDTKYIPIIPIKLNNTIEIIAYCRLPVRVMTIVVMTGNNHAVDFPEKA